MKETAEVTNLTNDAAQRRFKICFRIVTRTVDHLRAEQDVRRRQQIPVQNFVMSLRDELEQRRGLAQFIVCNDVFFLSSLAVV